MTQRVTVPHWPEPFSRTSPQRARLVGLGAGAPARFLTNRTGRPGSEDALQVAKDLGHLPLALAQAAAVIVGQSLDYATYKERLRGSEFTEYLYRTADDPYPTGVISAVLLSLNAVETSGNARICREVMELAATVSPAGIRRIRLYAASTGSQAEVDAALHSLVDSSLLTWTGADGSSVTAHRLIARIVRERAINDRTMREIAKRISKIFNLANQKDASNAELPDELKPSLFLWVMLKATVKVMQFIYRKNPVEKLADEELQCVFALADNLAPIYSKLSISSQTRVDMFTSYRDGYYFSARVSGARALENAGRLAEAVKEYESLITAQERAILPHRIFLDATRRDLIRVRSKLQDNKSHRDQ